ncbi:MULTISPECIES: nicotinate phosphoribosyltransferase [unclassified Cryobacterium]|uniref:nicotinate phosphoribosyltransferase n=1 Tax=unclassified Cryobacterium TaxID=2649013 RepID=UPI00106AA229|nr:MULTISPECIES: nicotinate phosphoribosyltransferase [unclassified Cryobacterium]TFC56070.1 nicotinate phosphoribosyltransferase [Cryobacterium sp. TMB3-1-2]TFC69696.1 nicotinate phosphoribosyltransferase [Cryobacterium sp. TMB3-15]TFC78062.1 nicotinate phosphoribosyltransferase [Cryobacterium sp. TMB3-10]TFC84845.1 nicotinate phosphoribosyltransferase [Cryobacterium sp. TMT4-31]TFD39586.1 nicotinate phosphoribosyltransferase [Cryobacterium sp. TMB3-12]
MTETSAFRTDRYELTMVDAAIQSGTANRECMFEAFARRLPAGRRYGIVAGTGRLLDLIRDFRFDEAELDWLRANNVVRPPTLDWLADYSFSGNIWGYREGDAYFPGSPLIQVDGTFAECVVLETLILSVLNYDSAVASAAARMVSVSLGRPLAEMGSRRTGEHSAVAAARAAYIAGFASTSNLEAGRSWGIPTMGTAAHSFTLLHDTEEDAFRAQVDAFGASTTLLVDTYNIERGIELAVSVAGTGLGSIRIDSGDLPTVAAAARAQLDSLGAVNTQITVTSDLDEYSIAALSASPVDAFGVGTSLVTGSGAPAAGMVYKLVAHRNTADEWVSVAKTSASKASVGGRKSAVRLLDATGTAREEIVMVAANGPTDAPVDAHEPHAAGATERSLLVPLMEAGVVDERYVGSAGTRLAREQNAAAMRELPIDAFRLGRGDAVIPTVFR